MDARLMNYIDNTYRILSSLGQQVCWLLCKKKSITTGTSLSLSLSLSLVGWNVEFLSLPPPLTLQTHLSLLLCHFILLCQRPFRRSRIVSCSSIFPFPCSYLCTHTFFLLWMSIKSSPICQEDKNDSTSPSRDTNLIRKHKISRDDEKKR